MIRCLALACLAAGPLGAQEYIVTDGPLSDAEFYYLVACAARPGEGCNAPLVRWDPASVTVSFAPIPASYPADLARMLDQALTDAVSQINGAAPGLSLRRVSKSAQPDIRIFLQPIRAGDPISGTGYPDMDGTPIGAAQVQIFWDADHVLTEGVIVFAADIPLNQAGPIMIEELTQAMGLMTDIRNPYYEPRSVFSEDSNSVAKLGAQDRRALQFHYPAE